MSTPSKSLLSEIAIANVYDELPMLDISMIPPIHKGMIRKRHPRNKKKLQVRWLSLYEDRLIYSKEEMGTQAGVIPLDRIRAEIRADERNTFEVCYDNMFQRRYQFVTKTDVDRAMWLWKINCSSYLKYGATRRPLSNITVMYLQETMGIDKIKKLINQGYNAASEHFLNLGSNEPEKLKKENSLDSEASTSSEEKAYRAEEDHTYANLDDWKREDEIDFSEEEEEEEQTFGVLDQDDYLDLRTTQDNENSSSDYCSTLPLSIISTLTRQKHVFTPAEVMSSKGKKTLPATMTDASTEDAESGYIDHNSVNTILDMLKQKDKAAENPYDVLPDVIDDIPPPPEKDPCFDHSPVHFLANALKKVIHSPSAPPMPKSGETESQYDAENIIRVKCVGQRDFIEVEMTEFGTTYDSLLQCFSDEFQLSTEDILLVRKLPDVLVRSDKDVRRITAKQEFELELRK